MGEHMLTKGEKFPSFSLENQDGAVVTNETLKGRKAILLSLIPISETTRQY